MSIINGMPVNFTISPRARSEIGKIRREFSEQSPADKGAVWVAWGTTTLNSGESWENVVVSFYSNAQTDEYRHAVERVSGLDVVFFITPENYDKFAGKVLDWSSERFGFILV